MKSTRETIELGALWAAWWASHSLEDTLQLIVLGLSIIGGLLYIAVMLLKIRALSRGQKEGD